VKLFRAERRGTPNFDRIPTAYQQYFRDASQMMTPLDGLKVAAVVACVGLRAGVFAQLPLKVYRDSPQGIAAPVSPTPDLFRAPSDAIVPSVWKSQMSISRDLFGFALGYITAFDAAMYPTKVEWLDPASVRHTLQGGRIEWRMGTEVLDPSMLVHVPSRWVLPGYPVGMSPLEHSGLVDLAKRAQEFGRDWFRNGGVPSAILYSDQEMTADQADAILSRIKARWTSRQPAVLGSGLRYEQNSVKAEESQFLETVRQAAADVAVSFNLPPEKIGAAISGQSITYSNRDQQQQQYLIDSINPDLVVVQESLDRFTPRGQYCKFTTAAFLRSDTKTRFETYELGIRAGVMTPNEARALEEWQPLPGGDSTPEPQA